MSTVVSSSRSTVSPDTPRVTGPLAPYPRSGIIVPLMSAVAESPGRPAKAIGAPLAVDGGEHRVPHECASAPWTGDGVDLGNDCVVQFKVHSHVWLWMMHRR